LVNYQEGGWRDKEKSNVARAQWGVQTLAMLRELVSGRCSLALKPTHDFESVRQRCLELGIAPSTTNEKLETVGYAPAAAADSPVGY
jgi:hypothetical protein